MDVVNRNPTFGSSLLNDNFGRRPTEDDMKALDPLHLEAAYDASVGATENRSESEGQSSPGQSNSPLLQNPNGATQMFNDMHGIPVGVEDGQAPDSPAGRSGMQHMARLTAGAERTGVTDWCTGTDGGRSCKTRVGVPYGSFAGV